MNLDDRIAAALPHAQGVRPSRARLSDTLRALADAADGHDWDSYGSGGVVGEVEERAAHLLGTDDAAFFPSGIMAQQCALRVWSDRMGSRRIALPDLAHLVLHESDGPRVLHGFEYLWLTTGPRTPTAADVTRLPGEVGAVLVELPLRDGGYLLPSWEELVAVSETCRERGIPLHLDGARLWESVEHLGHSLEEVCALADTVYVSMYKGLDGLSGAVLAGPSDVVEEARLWRHRLGGTVWTCAPHALSALRALDNAARLPQSCREARELAGLLHELGVRTAPKVPHTNAFRAFLPGSPEGLRERAADVVEAGIAVPTRWAATDVPGWCFAEVTVMPDGAAELDAYASALASLATDGAGEGEGTGSRATH